MFTDNFVKLMLLIKTVILLGFLICFFVKGQRIVFYLSCFRLY